MFGPDLADGHCPVTVFHGGYTEHIKHTTYEVLMMNYIKLALISLTLGSTVSIADDCTAPRLQHCPMALLRSMEQMLAGQKAVKDYQAANTDYRACLDPLVTAAQVAAAGDSPGPDLTNALVTTQ